MKPLRVYQAKGNTSGAEMLLHIKSIHIQTPIRVPVLTVSEGLSVSKWFLL